jgi:hypothetical protein
MGADRAAYQRVAVGRRLGHELGAERAAGAGTVVHDDLLAPGFAQLLRDQAAQDVGRAARLERHDIAYGFRRIGLSDRSSGQTGAKRGDA